MIQKNKRVEPNYRIFIDKDGYIEGKKEKIKIEDRKVQKVPLIEEE